MTAHKGFTHVAYSDEAYYSEGLYHSISLLTLSIETAEQLREKLEDILNKSGISEFKWKKVKKRSKKYYFCAKKILDLVIDFALKNKIRCCKKHKLGVSLKSSEGLWTPNPGNPINFWTFKAQSSNEKTKQVPLSHFKRGG